MSYIFAPPCTCISPVTKKLVTFKCFQQQVGNCECKFKMASREEWCAEKLSKLLNEELRISTLCEIKNHLTSVPQEEAAITANILQLPLVFDCLNDSNTYVNLKVAVSSKHYLHFSGSKSIWLVKC